jgi:hypothetical protein
MIDCIGPLWRLWRFRRVEVDRKGIQDLAVAVRAEQMTVDVDAMLSFPGLALA